MSRNIFAAFASDSDGDEVKNQEVPQKQPKKQKQPKPKQENKNRDDQVKDKIKSDDEKVPWKDLKEERPSRGRGDRDRGRGERGRGRGDRGDRGRGRGRGDRYRGDRYRGDRYRGDRYRGDRYRGDRYRGDRGRGRGRRNFDEDRDEERDQDRENKPKYYDENEEGNERGSYGGRRSRGRGGRGGHRYKYHIEGAYTKAAPRSEVLTEKDREVEEQVQKEIDAEADENQKHYGHDKKSGSGFGKEVKKGGAGKAGWGADEFDNLENKEADVATGIAEEGYDNQGGKPKDETEGGKPEDQKQEGEAEEKEDTTISYAEYLEQKKKANESLLKTESRAPEEIKMSNIEKHTDAKKEKLSGSTIKSHESYAPTGIKADVELGFGAAPDEESEETYYDRPPRGGRGRGRRGRGRGGFNDRGGFQSARGKTKKFMANDEDFPSL